MHHYSKSDDMLLLTFKAVILCSVDFNFVCIFSTLHSFMIATCTLNFCMYAKPSVHCFAGSMHQCKPLHSAR